MTTLLPTEQRVVAALERHGLALDERIPFAVVERLAVELNWAPATVKRELAEARKALALHTPPRAAGALTAREERLVDELERLGYSVAHRIPQEALEEVAERLGGVTLSATRNLLVKVRKTWGVESTAVRSVREPLHEAPTLPLGCGDPAVVARCQREGRRLAETARPRWRGW